MHCQYCGTPVGDLGQVDSRALTGFDYDDEGNPTESPCHVSSFCCETCGTLSVQEWHPQTYSNHDVDEGLSRLTIKELNRLGENEREALNLPTRGTG